MRCSTNLGLLVLWLAPVAAAQGPALDARLAPDGGRVAYRAMADGAVRLFVRQIDDSTSVAVTPAGVSVETYAWAPDARRLVYRAAADGHLYVVAPGEDPRDLTPGASGPVRLAGFAPEPVAAVVELPGRWPGAPDLHRVDLATGEHVPLVVNDGGVREWLVDAEGVPVVGVREGPAGEEELVLVRGDTLTPFYSCGVGETCDALGMHVDGRVWVRSNRNRPAPALVLVDPLTLGEEIVRADLRADPAGVFRSDSLFRRDTTRLREALGRLPNDWQEPVAGASRMLVTARDSAGATLYLFDRWAGTVRPLLPLTGGGSGANGPAAPVPDTLLLREAELRYRVTDAELQTPPVAPVNVERRIERRTERGRAVWRVVDEAEVPVFGAIELDTAALMADPTTDPTADPTADPTFDPTFDPPEPEGTADAEETTLVDAATLSPISRTVTGPVSSTLVFGPGSVTGTAQSAGFETAVDVTVPGTLWADGAALELLVAALPLAEGYATRLVLFDSEALDTATVRLVVEGSDSVRTPAGAFDVWRLTIAALAGTRARQEWLVRREAPHYVVRAITRFEDLVRTVELTDVEGLR